MTMVKGSVDFNLGLELRALDEQASRLESGQCIHQGESNCRKAYLRLRLGLDQRGLANDLPGPCAVVGHVGEEVALGEATLRHKR
jgi:hypothetical protein